MKLTIARLKSLIREEFSRMTEGFDEEEIVVEDGETVDQAEQRAEAAAADYDVVMLNVPMSMKDAFIERFGDEGRHGAIDNERYSLTYKN
jgi:prephenate dehydrogenase